MKEEEKDKEEEAAAPAWGVIKNKVVGSVYKAVLVGRGGGEPKG